MCEAVEGLRMAMMYLLGARRQGRGARRCIKDGTEKGCGRWVEACVKSRWLAAKCCCGPLCKAVRGVREAAGGCGRQCQAVRAPG